MFAAWRLKMFSKKEKLFEIEKKLDFLIDMADVRQEKMQSFLMELNEKQKKRMEEYSKDFYEQFYEIKKEIEKLSEKIDVKVMDLVKSIQQTSFLLTRMETGLDQSLKDVNGMKGEVRNEIESLIKELKNISKQSNDELVELEKKNYKIIFEQIGMLKEQSDLAEEEIRLLLLADVMNGIEQR